MKSFLFCLSVLLLIGCGEGPLFSKKVSIPEGGWTYESPLTYNFDINSSESQHDLFLSLTYSQSFGYQNVYVKIITEYPTLETVEDIVSLNITNSSGTFLGDCNSSECKIDILLQEKFKFKETGNHIIKIYQHSRENELTGIYAAELKLFESNIE